MKTLGLSPKFYAAVFMAVLGYLATQELVDFPSWGDLLVQVGLVGGGVFVASPGNVAVEADDLSVAFPDETGEVDIGAVLVCIVLALLIVFLVERV
jgi:hypothetical protein